MKKKKTGNGWKRALAALEPKVGETFKDGAYRLQEVDLVRSRCLFERVATGSPVTITSRLLDRCWSATAKGGALEYRVNGPTGISYTIATQYLVVEALGLKRRESDGKWVRS